MANDAGREQQQWRAEVFLNPRTINGGWLVKGIETIAICWDKKDADRIIADHAASWLSADESKAARLREHLPLVLQLAREAIPSRSHKGSCSPETLCDMDCANAYYCEMAIGFVQQVLDALTPPASNEGDTVDDY